MGSERKLVILMDNVWREEAVKTEESRSSFDWRAQSNQIMVKVIKFSAAFFMGLKTKRSHVPYWQSFL